MTTTAGVGAPGRAEIAAKTLRTDRWWLQPLITFTVLVLFIIYSTIRAFMGRDFFVDPYISPFYSPCLSASGCGDAPSIDLLPSNAFFTPAIFILIFPLGFRLTCYYYRKAYYRSFWLSPPACAVAEPHKSYSGETKVPLIGNNIHRYFFYAGLVFNVILTYDAIIAFRFETETRSPVRHRPRHADPDRRTRRCSGSTACPATPAGTSWAAGSTTSPSTRSATSSGPSSPSSTTTT